MFCAGCGRHPAEVDADVKVRFCNNCFTVNGNYFKYLAGLPMVKPLEDVHVKDVVQGCDGELYKVLGKGEMFKGDKYFPCKRLSDKKEITLGDFFFVKKVEQ